jgi:hypothetical protein
MKFFVPGHSHFSPDRCFSWITQNLNRTSIYTPEDVEKKVNEIHSVERKEPCFYDYRNFFDNHFPLIPGISHAAEIGVFQGYNQIYINDTIIKNEENSFALNYDHVIQIGSVNNTTSQIFRNIPPKPFSMLTQRKKSDLKDIMKKGIIPTQYHDYYKKLLEFSPQ